MKRYVILKHINGDAIEMTSEDNWKSFRFAEKVKLLRYVDADSWDEACTQYHEYMGYEPYVPMPSEFDWFFDEIEFMPL